MQYSVRSRRRLRPTTGEQAAAPLAQPTLDTPLAPVAEGSGAHRRPQPLVVTEINLTIPFQGRTR